MLFRVIRGLVLGLVGLFYPRIELRGWETLPVDTPLIFVLNHPNGLLDPLVLMIGLGRPVVFLAKSTLFGNPLALLMMRAFGALPIYRQQDRGSPGDPSSTALPNNRTFARCRALLRAGQPLALFPEGTTHSAGQLQPLKTGAARIALSAEDEAGWQLGVQIVPVGLWFQQKWRFRSGVLLLAGEPFDLSAYAATYAAAPFQAVAALTERIDASLDRVVLQADNAELLQGMPVLAGWTDEREPASLATRHRRANALLAGYHYLAQHDPARLEALNARAWRYARTLRMLGIRDPWDLELPPLDRFALIISLIGLGILAPLALAGLLLSYLPYRLAGILVMRFLGGEPHLVGTGKLIAGAALVLLGWIAIGVAVGFWRGAGWGLFVVAVAPLLSYIALRWVELARELRETTSMSWLRLTHADLTRQLIERRQRLAADIRAALAEVEGRAAGDADDGSNPRKA